MADYMGSHNTHSAHNTHTTDGSMGDKDMSAMMLPHTSLNEASNMLSPSSDGPPGLTSPSYMSHVSNANDYVSQSPQDGFLSHSALTGLAAAAAHHARFASTGQSPGGSSSTLQALAGSPVPSGGPSTPQPSPVFGGSSGGAVETSDMGSGGATLSISYMRQGDNYVCSLCGKTVASKAAITRHIQLTHEKKKPFECNICHRRFGYKNILLEHQNIHFGIKPYSCNLCDKRFAARSNLFQHRLLHMKPFHCEVCNKRFDRADQLQRHLKLHPTSNVLSCNLCNFQASNVEALNNHLKKSHTLQTFNTRSRFSHMAGDFRVADLPTQVPLSMAAAVAGTSSSSGGMFPGGEGFQSNSPMPPREEGLRMSPQLQHQQDIYPGDTPTSSMSAHSFARQAAGQFLTPNRRAASVGSIPGIQAFSRQNRINGPPASPLTPQSNTSVRSSADSTSNLSEFFSTLQGMIQRSQDIPELQVTIARPKTRQDASTQHTAVSVSGDVPSLSDMLVYYESQGKIYRCHHCKILFEERGMYFLHKSLHGEQSPWECSMCHKICADKNDFHLHFVNEQHQAHNL
ncbi:uncharacterized protein LOC143287169 [Babylonia areolata]|uniref:uncharacterized protein LOC143287167 n=1 Tax=Babylonia areolata TaxID=304850 RepID=UPI003FD091C2